MKYNILFVYVLTIFFSGFINAASVEGVIEAINEDYSEIYIDGKRYNLSSKSSVEINDNSRDTVEPSFLDVGTLVEVEYKGKKVRKVISISLVPQ